MRNLILLISVLAISLTAKSQHSNSDDTLNAKIVFTETSYNYGTLAKGVDAIHIFKFKNEGNIPLTIAEVKPSCGCTTPFWTKEPIKPGDSGEIKISYDSNRIGVFSKSITVTSNANSTPVILKISGEVIQ